MDNELYHYGVLGMKWGRHKARSSSESGEHKKKAREIDLGETDSTSSYRKKQTKKLSTEELSKRVKRSKLEQQYKDAVSNRNAVTRGHKALKRIVIVAATGAAISVLQANFRDLMLNGGRGIERTAAKLFPRMSR